MLQVICIIFFSSVSILHLRLRYFTGYKVLMPSLKGKRHQLTTAEANQSRRVTKIRWVVESIHGIIGQKYRILHNQLDNKLLPKLRSYCRVASFLNNQFGKRVKSDPDLCDEIFNQMVTRNANENSLALQVENKGWVRKKVPFQTLNSTDISDFPQMTERDLTIFFTGSYQVSQAVSYLAEIMDRNDHIQVLCLKVQAHILKMSVRSRHVNSKSYKCFIDYEPNSIGYSGIKRYCCECANGNRTIGCCSHIAAIIYYLAYGRYLSKIIRPAEILSSLFTKTKCVTVINEDSDED